MQFGRLASNVGRIYVNRPALITAILMTYCAFPVEGACTTKPQLSFSTFLGGSQFEHVRDLATDAAGNIYAVGGTRSPNFPATRQIVNSGATESGAENFDVFVVKMNPSGAVLWSTRIGGPNYDRAYGVELDPQGNIVVVGRAGRGFPVTSGAFQTQFLGGAEAAFYGNQDGFLLKLSSDGQRIIWASYFGTNDARAIRDVAVDKAGGIYLATNRTTGTYVPAVAQAFLNAPRGGSDGVLAKVAADGSRILWARYVGGSGDEGKGESSVQLDPNGNVFYLTLTRSADAPTTTGAAQRKLGGGEDVYLTKWSSTGAMVYGTYLGGSAAESYETHNLAVDSLGNAYVGAMTSSVDFPTTAGAFDRTQNGNGAQGLGDGFITKISPTGGMLASTYFGGNLGDLIEGIAVDTRGVVHITGRTLSTNLPVTTSAYQRTLRGSENAFYAELPSDLQTLLYSTYFGAQQDIGRALAVDASGNAIFGGETYSASFPRLNAADGTFGGVADAFVTRFATNSSGACLTAVVNTADNAPGVAPGGLTTITGSGLTEGVEGTVNGGGASDVRGTSVTIGGAPAPILSISQENGVDQIMAQTPFEAARLATVEVAVNNNGNRVVVAEETVRESRPGIFETTANDGSRVAALSHADGQLVSSTNPARAGEVVSLYFTGGGALASHVPTGAEGPAKSAAMALPVTVHLGDSAAEVVSAGYAAGAIGVYEVKFRVPAVVAEEGMAPLRLSAGGSEAVRMIAVK